MLAAISLDRQSVYIANVIPWRPPGNRTPTPHETEICRPFIERLQRSRASSNEWWLANLWGLQERPERIDGIRLALDQYAAVTPAETQEARSFLPPFLFQGIFGLTTVS